MSLRAYFDTAPKSSGKIGKDGDHQKPSTTTVKTGADAARHRKQAHKSLEKLRANQARRREKVYA